MYDHHVLFMWQQNERRLIAAAERRRLSLEAIERSRIQTESDYAPEKVVDTPAPTTQAATQLVTSASC